MAELKPKKLILEYEDGSTTAVDFAALPGLLQFDLLRQPFAGGASPQPDADGTFVVLEWEDGWKEVFEIDAAYTDIIKYYVITRPEDVGRLSFKRPDGYPELIELARRPLGVKRIAFRKDYALEKGVNRREGKKYEQEYKLQEAGEAFGPEIEAFRAAAADAGVTAAQLLSMDGSEMATALDDIRRRMGLVAGRRQRDVLDFVAYLARQTAGV